MPYKSFSPRALWRNSDYRIEAGNYKMILEHLVIPEGKYQSLLGHVKRDTESNWKLLPWVKEDTMSTSDNN